MIPHWDKSREDRKVREMVYLGIPSKMRGSVWCCAIGNRSGMSRDLFEIYVRHAREEMELNLEDGTGRLIEVDLPRTFPNLRFFDATGPYHKDLMDLLAAWAQYRPDVGYVQGMTHIAGMFLMHMGTYEAFNCFVNVMEGGGVLLAFYLMELDLILQKIKIYDALFRFNAPRLFARFQALDVSPNYYLLDWIMTMFTRVLTVPQASRIWDVYFLEGEIFLYKAALGIVLLFEQEFMAAEFEGCLAILKKLANRLESMSENDIMASILSVKIPSNVKTSQKKTPQTK